MTSVSLGAVWTVTLAPGQAEAGTLLIPAWSFARGNARICADPAEYANAGAAMRRLAGSCKSLRIVNIRRNRSQDPGSGSAWLSPNPYNCRAGQD